MGAFNESINWKAEVEDLFRTRKALVDAEKMAPRLSAVPGENEQMQWVQRGPNNVGGRTKAMMFDPNDNTNETVFAGGVSGGLFKNTNISNPNNPWELVTQNIPQNIAVSSIVYDPNNTKVFYVGTGESYTAGDALEMVFGNPKMEVIAGLKFLVETLKIQQHL